MSSVERVSLVQQVVKGVQHLVAETPLRAGDRLPTESDLCARFDVGRSTIREALHVLQALGTIEIKPGRGSFVASGAGQLGGSESAMEWLTQGGAALRDLVEIRTALEPIAARLAAERGTPEQIEELRSVHKLFTEATRREDVDAHDRALEISKLDEEFHGQIARMAQNKVMLAIERSINESLLETRIRSFSVPERVASAVWPHAQILAAIERRDPAGAAVAMEMHMREAYAQEPVTV